MPSQDALVVPTHEYLDRWSVGDLALAKTKSGGPETETKTTSPETKTQTKTDCSETQDRDRDFPVSRPRPWSRHHIPAARHMHVLECRCRKYIFDELL